MKQITTYTGQSLIDIAIQVYGDITGVEWLMEDNNIELTEEIVPGTKLITRETVINSVVVGGLILKGVKPNSAITTVEPSFQGISIWAIEQDFIIQ